MALYYQGVNIQNCFYDGYNLQQVYFDNVLVFGHHFYVRLMSFAFGGASGIRTYAETGNLPNTGIEVQIGANDGFPAKAYPEPIWNHEPDSYSTQVINVWYPDASEGFMLNVNSKRVLENIWSETLMGHGFYDKLMFNEVQDLSYAFSNCQLLI